jgi:hypothetical protein
MSRMSDLALDIEDLVKKGRSPMDVARDLEIPINWVYEAQEVLEESQEVLSPFATINS